MDFPAGKMLAWPLKHDSSRCHRDSVRGRNSCVQYVCDVRYSNFKKAFDRVRHEALWATMRNYNINASIIRAIENLYDKAQSAVLFNGSTGVWFRTTVGVRQGCLLSPTVFNIFLERIMCEALDDHEGSVSIGGRLIINFRFADDIVVNAEKEEEAGVLKDHLDRPTTRNKWRSVQTRQK